MPEIDVFQIGNITKFPVETAYPNVVAAVHSLLRRCPAGTDLAVDATGIGQAVADMFRFNGVAPWCVTATSGIDQVIDIAKRTAHVPKLMLVSRLQALLYEGRLKISDKLPEARAFLDELRDFRVEYSASGNTTYNAKSGRHDDAIAATGVAVWRLSDGNKGWGLPSKFMAAVMLGIKGVERPSPWVIGLDLGKMGDQSVAVVLRRVSVDVPAPVQHDDAIRPMDPVPEIEIAPTGGGIVTTPHLPGNPESTAMPPDLGAPEWRHAIAEWQKREVLRNSGGTATGPLAPSRR